MIKQLSLIVAAGGLTLHLLPLFLAGKEIEVSGLAAEKAIPGAVPVPSAFFGDAEEKISLADRAETGAIVWFSDWFREGKSPVPDGWDLDNKKQPIEISLSGRGEESILRLRSQGSAFGVYKKQEIKIGEYPFLNWEWKVTELPEGGSFLDKATDDQAAQIYVSFGSLSFFNKPFVKAVGYYWSSTVPVGIEGECPTWGKSRVIVLRSGSQGLGQWKREKRNLAEDYRRLFGDAVPPAASALRLYTNSQHTGTGTEVFFRNIYFSRE